METKTEATVARLFCGEVQAVINGLQNMEARDAQSAEEIRKLIGYLTNNQGRRVLFGIKRLSFALEVENA